MKKYFCICIYISFVKLLIWYPLQQKKQVQVAINLDEITNDQVMVTVNAPSIKKMRYYVPHSKTVPEPIQKTTTVDTSKI
jgi:hypothetical protein